MILCVRGVVRDIPYDKVLIVGEIEKTRLGASIAYYLQENFSREPVKFVSHRANIVESNIYLLDVVNLECTLKSLRGYRILVLTRWSVYDLASRISLGKQADIKGIDGFDLEYILRKL